MLRNFLTSTCFLVFVHIFLPIFSICQVDVSKCHKISCWIISYLENTKKFYASIWKIVVFFSWNYFLEGNRQLSRNRLGLRNMKLTICKKYFEKDVNNERDKHHDLELLPVIFRWNCCASSFDKISRVGWSSATLNLCEILMGKISWNTFSTIKIGHTTWLFFIEKVPFLLVILICRY